MPGCELPMAPNAAAMMSNTCSGTAQDCVYMCTLKGRTTFRGNCFSSHYSVEGAMRRTAKS